MPLLPGLLSVSAETKASLEDRNGRKDGGIEARSCHRHRKGIISCHVLSELVYANYEAKRCFFAVSVKAFVNESPQ